MEKDNSCQIDLSKVVQLKKKLAEKGGRPSRRTVLFVSTCAGVEKEKIQAVVPMCRPCYHSNFWKKPTRSALAAAGLGSGDDVLLPHYTFRVTVNAVLNQNCVPVLADVDPKKCAIDPEEKEREITRKTRAIFPVHMFGQPEDIERTIN
jgi:hypothetical protein